MIDCVIANDDGGGGPHITNSSESNSLSKGASCMIELSFKL